MTHSASMALNNKDQMSGRVIGSKKVSRAEKQRPRHSVYSRKDGLDNPQPNIHFKRSFNSSLACFNAARVAGKSDKALSKPKS